MFTMTGLFSNKRPLVGVIHNPPSLGYAGFPGHTPALEAILEDVRILESEGFDGVLLENENDKPHKLVLGKSETAWLTRVACAVRNATKLPVGINVQRIDWEATIAVAAAAELAFARLDVFVDTVRMQGKVVRIDPAEVRALQSDLGADAIELWTDIQVKHADLIGEKPLALSAEQAEAAGASAVLVTSTQTGTPPSEEDLRAARSGVKTARVVIGSGLSPDNAARVAQLSDGAVVGTSLMRNGRIVSERARAMRHAWDNA